MRLDRARLCLLQAMLLCGLSPDSRAELAVTKVGDSVVDAKALTVRGHYGPLMNGLSFQQDAVVTHANHQYVAYYDAQRRVCIARRKLPAGDWKVIRLGDYAFRSVDAHNTISMGICPKDGTIHLSFDHHGHTLHYRVSRKNAATRPETVTWTASLFGPVISQLEKGKRVTRVTYPRFWQTPEGTLQFCYRIGGSGNGDRVLVDYEPKTGAWENTRRIDSGAGGFQDALGKSSSRCSYPNGYDYGPRGRLHVTWVWRERSQGSNHDIMYAYSEDRGKTWRGNTGEIVGKIVNINSPGITVVKIPRGRGLMNTQAQAVDAQGRIHVVMWHCTEQTPKAATWGSPDARRHHHYWRDPSGVWHHAELPGRPGSRPKLFMDAESNAYLIYNARRAPDDRAKLVLPPRGDLTIAAATATSQWKDWKIIHVEKGPFLNEMLGDRVRWKSQGVLSVMVQESAAKPGEPTRLRIIEFSLKTNQREK